MVLSLVKQYMYNLGCKAKKNTLMNTRVLNNCITLCNTENY